MTEREHRVKGAEIQLREQETRVREAQSDLEHGYKKLQADMEREYAKLKLGLEREQLKLEHAKSYLELSKAELARGYEA